MANIVATSQKATATVEQAMQALQLGNVAQSHELFQEVKANGFFAIKEAESLLERVCAVEKDYQEREYTLMRKLGQLSDSEQEKLKNKRQAEINRDARKRDLERSKSDLSSAEDEKRRQRRLKSEAEDSKNAHIAGAVGSGLLTVFSLGILAPITIPAAVICSAKAIDASDDEKKAENRINSSSREIDQCNNNIRQYTREIDQLECDLLQLSDQISIARSEQKDLRKQIGNLRETVNYLRDILVFWKEFQNLADLGTKRADMLAGLTKLSDSRKRVMSAVPKFLQDCVSAWDRVESQLEKAMENLFQIDYTCAFCGQEYSALPYILSGKYACSDCYR